jgi:hypothetical protein
VFVRPGSLSVEGQEPAVVLCNVSRTFNKI